MTDEYFDASRGLKRARRKWERLTGSQEELGAKLAQTDTMAASTFEAAAKRLEDIAAKLGNA